MNKRLFSQENEYYDSSHLQKGLFASVGDNVRIARNCTIVGEENISIGDNVRIDGYCTIIATGTVRLGSFIHIGSYCHLSGGEGITMEDFGGLSQGVYIYTRNDDYSGAHMTNPMVPETFSSMIKGAVVLKRHVIIGAHSAIMPGVTIGEGSAVGAQSLVKTSLDGWGIYAGNPVRRIRERLPHLLELEKQFKPQ
jgi:galactoside O-acetyltransferase